MQTRLLLQAITVEQINELSVEQLGAITASQQRFMSADQLTAIVQNGGTQKQNEVARWTEVTFELFGRNNFTKITSCKLAL